MSESTSPTVGPQSPPPGGPPPLETPPPAVTALPPTAPTPAPAPVVEVKPAAPAAEVKPPADDVKPAAPVAEVKPPAVEAKPVAKTNLALVIDDEPANRDFLVRLLQQAKLEVCGASTAAEALQIIDNSATFALIVIDNKLPDMNGVDLLIKLRPRFPEARMVMATMLDERQLMAKAFENGCDVFLVKPHGFMELFRRLQTPDAPGEDKLRKLIIDQYGPRPYRG